jgi:hypothetical protein
MVDLTNYKYIQSIMYVKLEIPGQPIICMSDYKTSQTIDGDVYNALGYFVNITDTSSDLKITNSELTITLNGVPNYTIGSFLSMPVKGSKVTVKRGLFQPGSDTLITVTGKFKGIVNNIGIVDNQDGSKASSTINLICKSDVGMVASRIAGRRTNPSDEKLFFPNDKSMDRVPALTNAKVNFGGNP